MADIEKVYEIMHRHDIPPLPTGKYLAMLDSEDEIPDGSLITGHYLPDQGDYRHVGDISKYHVFVPK